MVEKDKRRLSERGGGERDAVVRRQRQGCSRMRQDLITPYNVLFCGCLAYTPVPVCRLGNTVNTPIALSLLLSCLLSHSLLSIFSSLSRSFSSLSSSKCGWFVCTCHNTGLLATSTSWPFHLPSSLGSLCTSICPSIRKPYLRQGNKRVNLDIMAATVAAHKTIVQDISLASPFRVSAPLYRHAQFSFLFFSSFFFFFFFVVVVVVALVFLFAFLFGFTGCYDARGVSAQR